MPRTTHSFVSAAAEGGNATLVRTSNWNDEHVGMQDGSHNVLDYGALGNGSADDTTAIHAARTAAGTNGTVYIPAGTYIVTGLTLDVAGQTWLLASGATVKLKDSTADVSVLSVTAADVSIVGLGLSVIDGNKANQSSTNDMCCINTSSAADRLHLRGVELKNAHGTGIRLNGPDYVVIENCYIHDAGTAQTPNFGGIFADSGTCYLQIIGNRIGECTEDGIKIKGTVGSPSLAPRVIGNHIVGTTATSYCTGIELWNYCDRGIVADNYCELGTSTAQWGISLDGNSDCTVSGNTVYSAASAPAYNRWGIEVVGCNNTAVTGNTVDFTSARTGGSGEDNGISISNAISTALTITGNTVANCEWGVKVNGDVDLLTFMGNIIRTCDSGLGIGAGSIQGFVCSGNQFLTGTYCVNSSSQGGDSHLDWMVTDNIVEGWTDFIRMWPNSGTYDRITVRGNRCTSVTNIVNNVGGAGTVGPDLLYAGNTPDTNDQGWQAPLANAGVPASGTRNGYAEKGALIIDSSGGKLYINTGTKAATVWTVVGTQT